MTTIQLQVDDHLLRLYGREALQKRLQRFVEAENLRLLALEIKEAVEEAQEDNDSLWEEARRKAWEEYKIKVKGIDE